MKPSAKKPHYTITEVAKALEITRAAVHRAIKQRRLKAEWGPIGPPPTGWRVAAKDLKDYRVSLLHQWVGKKTVIRLTAINRSDYHPGRERNGLPGSVRSLPQLHSPFAA